MNDSELFTPAVLFLSVAARSQADQAAGGEPISIQRQRNTGLRIADERQVGIVKEFVEVGTPAISLRQRPVLRRMLAYLERHPDVRIAIFPGLHRFSRNFASGQHLYNRLHQLGIDVILASGDISTWRSRANQSTPQGVGVIAAMNKQIEGLT
ncbi:recombinase family protein [Nocardia wallacei]|uniref:recombinase family protein n=1 Tax=Nocardia wallacei TaxID=480035 RepID=UPI0024557EB0|nr:recombinase family protein [Nocardia wallacei]